MVFSSIIFLFAFLPVFLGCYFLLPARYRNLWVVLGSYAFYAWWRVDFLLLLVAVTALNYVVGLRIAAAHAADSLATARRWMGLGVAVDLAVLGYFKYANFGVDSFNLLLKSSGLPAFDLAHVILPIGISFYIFQAISYLVDVYRRDTEAATKLTDLSLIHI